MELLHFSAINEAYHKGILRSWKVGGCLDDITNRLGYRLALTAADFNEKIRPGGLLNLAIRITNTGFASLMNPRPVYGVLIGPDALLPDAVRLDLDPRTWQPGASSFTAKIRLPSKIGEGEYDLAVWLPDEAESLRQNPFYAVQFANEGVWDEMAGYNMLGKLSVDSSVTGSMKRTDFLQVEALLINTAN
jgi:hypothetical protein